MIFGFMVLFLIFGISSYLQWEYSQEIKNVSEYHKRMSIPSISTLNDIKINFQMIHMLSIEMIQTDVTDERYFELQEGYQIDRVAIEKDLKRYEDLTFAKNSRGELLASAVMQNQMQDYIFIMKQILQNNDAVIKQYENKEILGINALPLLASIEEEFHNTIESDTSMEIRGMEKVQNQIILIEENMANIFFTSAILAIATAVGVIILTSKFVSIPISRLILMTKNISKGNFKEMPINSKNSDVNEIAIALNKMSKDLEIYKSKIIMQEKLSSIGELASRLAHDIKNPLTVIKVTLDVIKTKNKNLSEEELEKFQRVNEAMYRITHQIDNVLDFIKGKPLQFEKFSIEKIIDSVIEDIPKTDKIKILVVSENLEIDCDFEAMKVVLINLVVNAMQAIEGEGEIKVSSKIREDKAIIEIQDSGPGIPQEKLEKIFEPLYTTKQEGTGLGLASCKSLIEQHHGTISVKNNPTRFIIEIPRKIEPISE